MISFDQWFSTFTVYRLKIDTSPKKFAFKKVKDDCELEINSKQVNSKSALAKLKDSFLLKVISKFQLVRKQMVGDH